MAREFVSRWAMIEALADDIVRGGGDVYEASPSEIAAYLVEAGWRPGGDDA